MNTRKNKIISVVLLVFITIVLIYGAVTRDVRAESIEQYEAQIQENNNKISALEEVKNQLHITAKLLRENEYINNGLDTALSQKWHECHNTQDSLINEVTNLENKITEIKEEQKRKKYIGKFKITHYCPCTTCNGSWGNKTALGTKMTPYRTIAVDPKVIPLGSKVEINGKIYIAEDTGGAIKGNRIDLCVGSHSEAYNRGVLYNVPVYIVK